MIRVLVIGICLSLLSCSTPAVEKPDPFIEKEQMINILYDISLLNAVSNSKKDYLKQRGIVPIKTVYQWYGVDSLSISRNDVYYASKPKVYREIYKRVNDSLEAIKDVYDEGVRLELLKRKDSVDNSKSKTELDPKIQDRKAPPKRPSMSNNRQN